MNKPNKSTQYEEIAIIDIQEEQEINSLERIETYLF